MTKDNTRDTNNTALSGPTDANTNNTNKLTRGSMRGKSQERPGEKIIFRTNQMSRGQKKKDISFLT